MNNVVRYNFEDKLTQRRLQSISAALPPGDGGGTSDGMEPRVRALEVQAEYVKRDLTDLRADMSAIRKDLGDAREKIAGLVPRVEALPTKDFVVKLYVGGFVALLGLLGALTIFQGQVQHWIGLRP